MVNYNNIINCVGIIGLGVGLKHLDNLYKQAKCKEIIVYDNNIKLLKKINKKYLKKIKIAKNEDEIYQNKKLTLVVIASYDFDHYKHIVKGIEYNKNIFCEKPFCINESELKKIIKKIKKYDYNKKLFVNHVLRTAPLYKWLKKEISKNRFGEIYYYEGQYLYGRINNILHAWRGKDKRYSAFHGGGIHLIDLLVWLLNIKPIQIKTNSNKFFSNKTQSVHEDFYDAQLFHKNKLQGKILVDLCCAHKHQHIIKIFGTKKSFIYDDMGARIYERKEDKIFKKIIRLRALPKTKTEYFFNLINNQNTDLFRDIFDGISIANGCINSNKIKKIQKVNYFNK